MCAAPCERLIGCIRFEAGVYFVISACVSGGSRVSVERGGFIRAVEKYVFGGTHGFDRPDSALGVVMCSFISFSTPDFCVCTYLRL